ncbi:DUF192 domain-containing protein [Pelagibius sp. Alg239-R121]|uniref:DUF192 domain-containing protein n=1 Tax=Pelagibius sp. Alg239-R121 TaxID=2993448 RepID=UPI0024A772A3|nr:DUF192 domain-containing protein [Pelagibius sp. Alg239-R121]
MTRSLCRLILITIFSFTASAASAQSGLASFERDELTIVTEEGTEHIFDIELAVDPKQQAQGLMFRRQMPADAGMLFIYKPSREAVMWMQNTFLPLDMLFIKADGRIVKIVERTVPQSHKRIPAGEAITGVLELNGGTVSRLGIKTGDRVEHSSF